MVLVHLSSEALNLALVDDWVPHSEINLSDSVIRQREKIQSPVAQWKECERPAWELCGMFDPFDTLHYADLLLI